MSAPGPRRAIHLLVAAATAATLLLCRPTPAGAEAGRAHSVHVLANARIMVGPGRVIEKGSIVIRDGRIEAVGEHVPRPADARVHDLSGRVLHAGFIDPFMPAWRLEGKRPPDGPVRGGDDDDDDVPKSDPADRPPESSVVSSANARIRADWRVSEHLRLKADAVDRLRAQGFLVVQAVPDHGIFRGSAAIYSLLDGGPRRALLADDSASVLAYETASHGLGEEGRYPSSRMGVMALIRQAFLDAAWYRRARVAGEKRYAGTERPQTEASLSALQPVLDGQRPLYVEAGTLLGVLRTSALLDEVPVARRVTVLSGEEWRRLDWAAPEGGSARGDFVLGLSFPPAPKGERDGDWLDVDLLSLLRWRNAPANARWLAERGLPFSLTMHQLKAPDEFPGALRRAIDAGLPGEVALAALTTRPARLLGIDDRFGTLEPGKAASIVVRRGAPFEAGSRVEEVWVEGERHVVDHDEPRDARKKGKGPKKEPPAFPRTAYDRLPESPTVPAPAVILVKDATIWTQGPQGVLEHADLLVFGGRVRAVGRGLSAPGALVIDGRGRHVTPGLIDPHSHTAVDGSVNEASRSVTPEVRISDVINPFDRNILLQLAGGVTMAQVFHGSANTIGGQSAALKWRWGQRPEGLLVAGAPPGIKFALGENAKQSWRGPQDPVRYPQTRLGVAELIRERFVAAREYRRKLEEHRAGRRPVPPRPDLALEALLEVLDGKRWIHCHAYRQDEMLTLLHLGDEEGFRVRTFEHALEGYKVADELASRGTGASSFTDWWAYKMEVLDAIPYNGALMHRRGVLSSFNSDSPDLARRLNTEAAKAVRYGSLPEVEALAFVTLNAARQMGVDGRVGSLEPGKDGDFVLWSDHPLSQRAVALQTWIEGRRYFDREEHALQMRRLEAERQALVARARGSRAPRRGDER